MAPHSQPTNTTGPHISHPDENMTSPTTWTLTLPLAESGPFPGQGELPPSSSDPVLPCTQHDLKAIDNDSLAPPPSYTESDQGAIVGDSETRPHTCDGPSLSLHHVLEPNHNGDGSSLLLGAPEGAGTLRLYDTRHDNDSADRDELSLALERIRIHCITTCTSASKHLNWHVNSDHSVCRWNTAEGPIPVSINFLSFESLEEMLLVKKSFKIVLRKLNDQNIGPQFEFVDDPCGSAFFINFGGDHDEYYASSFFPGSAPRDWYVWVYKLGLTLSPAQEKSLKKTRARDFQAAKSQALEQNLTAILYHEMLHVIGVRHCVVDPVREDEPYVRFPLDLPDKDNCDPLMKATLHWKDMSKLDGKPQTLDEISQIYAMKKGQKIGSHEIQDISWRDGAEERMKIAKMNARCCIFERRKKRLNPMARVWGLISQALLF